MKKILIVDDHADIRRLIRWTLELENYEIHEAPDASSALAVAAQVRPDLVLMDVMMPGPINGLDACRQMKANPAHRGMQVILLTARGQSGDREAGQQAGSDQYIAKPFSPLNLIETVKQCLSRQP